MKVQIGNSTLYLGDCLDILPTLPKVDAVITDPPYGLAEKLEGGSWGKKFEGSDKDWDAVAPVELINMALQLSDKAIVWGGNYFPFYPSRCWLTWIKRDAVHTMAGCELAWTNFDANSKFFDWTIAATNSERVAHPTQKPLALMKWCIDQAGNPETILDPFMGSGTTGVAAIQMGRKFIGIEREPKYFEIACKRIEQAVATPQLFEHEPVKQVQMGLV
jgi:site-specific DNA-methyltransferase (adenine-specific)/modification methylase